MILYYTILHGTIPYCTYCTILLYYTILYDTMLHDTILAIRYDMIRYYMILYRTYCTILLYYTVQDYYTRLYNTTIIYNTIIFYCTIRSLQTYGYIFLPCILLVPGRRSLWRTGHQPPFPRKSTPLTPAVGTRRLKDGTTTMAHPDASRSRSWWARTFPCQSTPRSSAGLTWVDYG